MKIMVYSILTLLAANSAFAQTAKESDVLNKTRLVSLSTVNLKDGRPATVLADAQGITVYTFDLDKPGQSNCTGSCLDVWPTLAVPAGENPAAPFGTIQGNDGRAQLTLDGMPLYYYEDDKKPGDVFGDYPKWHPVIITK